jgi:hypothetical protein
MAAIARVPASTRLVSTVPREGSGGPGTRSVARGAALKSPLRHGSGPSSEAA